MASVTQSLVRSLRQTQTTGVDSFFNGEKNFSPNIFSTSSKFVGYKAFPGGSDNYYSVQWFEFDQPNNFKTGTLNTASFTLNRYAIFNGEELDTEYDYFSMFLVLDYPTGTSVTAPFLVPDPNSRFTQYSSPGSIDSIGAVYITDIPNISINFSYNITDALQDLKDSVLFTPSSKIRILIIPRGCGVAERATDIPNIGISLGIDYTEGSDISNPEIISMTVNSGGDLLLVDFNEVVTGVPSLDSFLSFESSSLDPLTVTYASEIGSTAYSFLLSRIVYTDEIITASFSGESSLVYDSTSNDLLAFSGFLVVNNSSQSDPYDTPDPEIPTVLSATVLSGGSVLKVELSEPCTGTAGFAVSGNTITSAFYFDDDTIYLLLDTIVYQSEVVTLSYSGTAINDIDDDLPLAAFTEMSVTNNSIQYVAEPITIGSYVSSQVTFPIMIGSTKPRVFFYMFNDDLSPRTDGVKEDIVQALYIRRKDGVPFGPMLIDTLTTGSNFVHSVNGFGKDLNNNNLYFIDLPPAAALSGATSVEIQLSMVDGNATPIISELIESEISSDINTDGIADAVNTVLTNSHGSGSWQQTTPAQIWGHSTRSLTAGVTVVSMASGVYTNITNIVDDSVDGIELSIITAIDALDVATPVMIWEYATRSLTEPVSTYDSAPVFTFEIPAGTVNVTSGNQTIYVKETGIILYFESNVDVSAIPIEVVFEESDKTDIVVFPDASLTKNSEGFTLPLPDIYTDVPRSFIWGIRNATTQRFYGRGSFSVVYAPYKDTLDA